MRLIDADALNVPHFHLATDKIKVLDMIDEAPTIDIDRPQGEWIVSDKDSVCSVCGKDEAEFICGTEDWYGYGLSNYCPNCGAKMKGADNERSRSVCHR